MRIAIILVLSIGFSFQVKAQSHEAQQLLLNYEKLKQLKNMLSDMKKGYQIVSKGYNSVKSIAEGNFSIHDIFLKGLVAVNPAIKNYWRVAEIIKQQKTLVSEYKTAFNRFSNSNIFNVRELKYFKNVYENLLKRSLCDLDELTTVITASKLSMSDEERLKIIDRLYEDSMDKLQFIRNFNQKNVVLMIQRKREMQNLKSIRNLYQP